MNYDLIILKITKPHLKQVIAHHIAADPAVSLQKALSLLDNLPLVYRRDLSFKELEAATLQLNKLGAVCRAVESRSPLDRKNIEKQRAPRISAQESIVHRAAESPDAGQITKARQSSFKAPDTGAGKNVRSGRKAGLPAGGLLAGVFFAGAIIFVALKFWGRANPARIPYSAGQEAGEARSAHGKERRDAKPEDGASATAGPARGNGRAHPDVSVTGSSDAFVDSASAACGDFECAIAFYRIAVSFNRKNLRAWQGLVAAYRGSGQAEPAKDAEKEMEKIFGGAVFTAGALVKPFGSLIRDQQDQSGVCRVEYRSLASERAAIEKETYYIARALAARGECRTISLYASTGRGKGMLVRVAAEGFPPRVSDYLVRASLSFTE